MNDKVIGEYIKYESNDVEEKIDMCKALEDMRRDATEQGMMIGRQEGRQEGEQRLAELIGKLIETGKNELIGRVVSNLDFRKKLFEEYEIN